MKVKVWLVISLIQLCFSMPAGAQTESSEEPENYVSAKIGWHDAERWKGVVDLGNQVRFDGRVATDPTWLGGLAVGREYEHSRFEIEFQQGNFEGTSILLNGLSESQSDADGHYRALTINATRMFELNERFEAFAGVGLGWGEVDLPSMGFANACDCFPEASESGFIWQGRLGIDYLYGRSTTFFAQFTRIFDFAGPVSDSIAPGVSYSERDITSFAVGIRYRF